MDEDNIFESHGEAKADFEMDWEDLLEELSDYEIPEERLSELAYGMVAFRSWNCISRTALSEFDG